MFSIGNKILETAPSGPSKRTTYSKSFIIWINLELTGSNPKSDQILEVGCIITDSNLDVIGETVHLVIHHSDDILNKMNDWSKEYHSQSGLMEKCRKSALSLAEAEDSLLSFLNKHTPKGMCPLAGHSVHMDKFFIMMYMPKVYDHIHHLVIDISTVKELCRRWSPAIFAKAPPKKASSKSADHVCLDDLHSYISDLKFYKKNLYK